MLEDPNYSEVVRWGDGGDSFVVLEVCLSASGTGRNPPLLTFYVNVSATEREVHQDHSAEAFQTQQLCQLRPAIEQVRLP